MDTILQGGNGAAEQNADLIKDTDTMSFMADVIDASREQPVVVDFWAPWCGPCKQLTPALEAAVRAAGGAVRLVKINVDENQEIAAQMRIQSIPAVFAFKDGQPVDGFMGALPESQVKSFIEKLAGAPLGDQELEAIIEAAQKALAENDLATAAPLYGEALQRDREDPRAIAGLAKCQIAGGDLDGAAATLALAPPAKQDDTEEGLVRRRVSQLAQRQEQQVRAKQRALTLGAMLRSLVGLVVIWQGVGWLGGPPAVLALLGGGFLTFTVSISRQHVGPAALAVGSALPSFRGTDDAGEDFRLDVPPGSPVLLKFFRGPW